MNTRHPFINELFRILRDEKTTPDDKLKYLKLRLNAIEECKKLRLKEAELYKNTNESIPDPHFQLPIPKELQEQLNINTTDEADGKTLLTIAIAKGYYDITKLLLSAGALPDFAEKDGGIPINEAAFNENQPILKLLLDAKVDPNQENQISGNAPIMSASACKTTECLKLLLEKKANLRFVNKKNHKTPLHFAAQPGRIDCLRLLLQAKADPNIADKGEFPPIYDAIRATNVEAIKELINHNASLNDVTENAVPLLFVSKFVTGEKCADIIKVLIEAKAQPNYQVNKRLSALRLAIHFSNVHAVGALLKAGADFNEPDTTYYSKSLLQYAFVLLVEEFKNRDTPEFKKENMHKLTEIIKLLLAAGANPNIIDSGYTPLLQAASMAPELVGILLEKKADIALRDKTKFRSPLNQLAQNHEAENVLKLILAGAEVNELDRSQTYREFPDGMTALDIAIFSSKEPKSAENKLKTVKELLERHAFTQYPEKLYHFLMQYDQSHPDVLFCLKEFCQQQQDLRDEPIGVQDSSVNQDILQHPSLLSDELFEKAKNHLEKLTELTEAYKRAITREIESDAEKNERRLPKGVQDIVSDYDPPLADHIGLFKSENIDEKLNKIKEKEEESKKDSGPKV